MDFKNFCQKIGYHFNNIKVLEEAITHPSFSKNDRHLDNYERLEFLGDKVLSLVISEYLMKRYPREKEGDLSKRHAYLVSGETISKIALTLEIAKILRLSQGEENSGGRNNKRNLENAVEALIGAIYIDSNYEEAKNFIFKFWQETFEQEVVPHHDPVSKLQEIVQSKSKQLPQYEIIKTDGSDHSPIFTAKLTIAHFDLVVEAQGKSKKEAQKEAALIALNKVK